MTERSIIQKIEQLSLDERKLLSIRLDELMKQGDLKSVNSESPKKLVAYVQSNDILDQKALKSYIKDHVPDYMVPSSIVAIEDIPLLPNGKVNKKALSKAQKVIKEEDSYTPTVIAPKNKTEEQLVEIWEEVLGFSPISTQDNFFEIGGDSILSIQIISKARKIGIKLAANQLFDHQTIADLAGYISENENKEDKWEYMAALRKGGSKKPLFCIHSGGGHVFFYGLLKDYMKPGRPIYALQPSGLYEGEKMHRSIEEMSADYLKAMREIQPQGPYNVLVYCFSTSVGNEMSIQLGKLGEEINIIVMDTMASPWNANDHGTIKVRLQSFSKRLFMAPLKTIKLFFKDRVYLIEPLLVKLFGKDHQKELEKLKANLRRMSVTYQWKKHHGKVSLILTEKPDQRFQNLIIDSWKKYAQGGVTIFPTKGNHTTLFEEPDIQYVSKKIDECIVD